MPLKTSHYRNRRKHIIEFWFEFNISLIVLQIKQIIVFVSKMSQSMSEYIVCLEFEDNNEDNNGVNVVMKTYIEKEVCIWT